MSSLRRFLTLGVALVAAGWAVLPAPVSAAPAVGHYGPGKAKVAVKVKGYQTSGFLKIPVADGLVRGNGTFQVFATGMTINVSIFGSILVHTPISGKVSPNGRLTILKPVGTHGTGNISNGIMSLEVYYVRNGSVTNHYRLSLKYLGP